MHEHDINRISPIDVPMETFSFHPGPHDIPSVRYSTIKNSSKPAIVIIFFIFSPPPSLIKKNGGFISLFFIEKRAKHIYKLFASRAMF